MATMAAIRDGTARTGIRIQKRRTAMTHDNTPAYGLWPLVFINSAVFILFAFSFARPRNWRDWRSFGPFAAFIVALFTEMYGFPLTIYLLTGWLGSRYPALNPYSHENGHLWNILLGLKGDPHFGPLHLLSNLFIIGGFFLLAAAWQVLYEAQTRRTVATTGPYERVRHPQYIGFLAIMFGFLLQWPTIPTLLMFPVLLIVYARLALAEEKQIESEFGDEWRRYAAETPRFFPHLSGLAPRKPAGHKPAHQHR